MGKSTRVEQPLMSAKRRLSITVAPG